MREEVRVVYRKYDGSLHWHLTMQHLGQDEHGTWLGMASGGQMRKGDNPPTPIPHAHVGLIPHEQTWWTAWFNGEPERVDVYCDITTPPTWPTPNEVTMIDLDLDVARKREDGTVHLLDEDEFADHQRLFRYPPNVVQNAEAAASWLMQTVGDGSEPFATVYKQWLKKIA